MPYPYRAVPEPIIEISNVDFAYGQQLALKHVSMTIERGTTVGVIGPNGGGKTTLVNLLLGLLRPSRGRLEICGMPPAAAVRRGDVVGCLPQKPPAPRGFPISVRQLVRLGLSGKTGLLGSENRDDLLHVEWLLQTMGIQELAEASIGSLSGGELQRAHIARALAARPHVLLLDEPTTGIDRAGQKQFIQFLADLKQSLALTVVLVSHDLRTVAAVSDRLACLNVTLHYHDIPANMPEELAREMFGVDLPELKLEKSA